MKPPDIQVVLLFSPGHSPKLWKQIQKRPSFLRHLFIPRNIVSQHQNQIYSDSANILDHTWYPKISKSGAKPVHRNSFPCFLTAASSQSPIISAMVFWSGFKGFSLNSTFSCCLFFVFLDRSITSPALYPHIKHLPVLNLLRIISSGWCNSPLLDKRHSNRPAGWWFPPARWLDKPLPQQRPLLVRPGSQHTITSTKDCLRSKPLFGEHLPV